MVISVHQAVSKVSISSGQGFLKCDCFKKCTTKKCKCRQNNVLCNSRCYILQNGYSRMYNCCSVKVRKKNLIGLIQNSSVNPKFNRLNLGLTDDRPLTVTYIYSIIMIQVHLFFCV